MKQLLRSATRIIPDKGTNRHKNILADIADIRLNRLTVLGGRLPSIGT